jgi:hypothetical protein
MNVALVEVDGQHALCVDVNNNGLLDAAVAQIRRMEGSEKKN